MKFVCERCHTRYSIADDKVRQKILKIRCKTCENVITVRDSGPVQTIGFGQQQSPLASAPPPPPAKGPAAAKEWFLAVNGEQTGPMTRADAARRAVHSKSGDEIYAWKDGQDGWKPPEEIAVIAQEMNSLKARPSAPVPRLPAPPPSRPPPPGKPAPARATKPMPAPFTSSPRATGSMGSVPATARVPDSDAFAEEEHTQIQPFDAGVLGAEMLGGRQASSHPAAPAAVLPFTSPAHHRAEQGAAPAPAALDGLFSELTPAPVNPQPGAPMAPASTGMTGFAALAAKRPSTMKFVIAGAVLLALVGAVVLVVLNRPEKQPRLPQEGQPPPVAAARPPAPAPAEQPSRAFIEQEQPRPQPPTPVVREVTRRTGGKQRPAPRTAAAATPSLEPAPLSPDQVNKPHAVAAGERRVPEFRSPRPAAGAAAAHVGAPSNEAIDGVVKKRDNQATLKTCYERALKRDNGLKSARIDVSVTIGTSGIVKAVAMKAPPEFATVESCIKNAVRHWAFPGNSDDYQIDFPVLLQGNQ
jgi:predicted Zn finger-like uncharacterized protein